MSAALGSKTLNRVVIGIGSMLLALGVASAVEVATKVKTSTGVICTIVGTASNNTLTGTAKNDVICGLGGNDVIKGVGNRVTYSHNPDTLKWRMAPLSFFYVPSVENLDLGPTGVLNTD